MHRALGITEEENLKLISDTVSYLKSHGREVVYDAEHFFDGYNANPRLRCAHLRLPKNRARTCFACAIQWRNAADALVEVLEDIRKRFDGILGIHPHNDSEWLSPMRWWRWKRA